MSKYTKGPWKYVKHMKDNRVYTTEKTKYHRVIIICEVFDHPQKPEEFEANARLISAAPELLEACKKFVDEFGRKDYPKHSGMSLLILEQSKKAIAKATNNN